MNKRNLLLTTAVTGLLALGTTGITTSAQAAGDMEKCYGVSKAGKNDCQTSSSSCAGTATQDNQADAWVYVPEGTCEKLTGSSTTAS